MEFDNIFFIDNYCHFCKKFMRRPNPWFSIEYTTSDCYTKFRYFCSSKCMKMYARPILNRYIKDESN